MELASTTNSQVVNNHIFQSGGLIPGYEPIMLIVVIGAMGTILAVFVAETKRKLA